MRSLNGVTTFFLFLCVACGVESEVEQSNAPLPAPMESEDPNETVPMESVEDDVVEAPMDELQANEMNARLSLAFEYLTGLFNSQVQSERNFAYFNVQLAACEVDAPDLGERVLYLEQAMMSNAAEPYRQRLYVIRDNGDGRVVSDVYSLYDTASAVGLCERDEVVAFTPEQVGLRQGCSVYLAQEGDAFVGGTDGKSCRSTLSGARYAVSDVTLTANQILSWDRGFDAADNQVWGAEEGPYEFLRQ